MEVDSFGDGEKLVYDGEIRLWPGLNRLALHLDRVQREETASTGK